MWRAFLARARQWLPLSPHAFVGTSVTRKGRETWDESRFEKKMRLPKAAPVMRPFSGLSAGAAPLCVLGAAAAYVTLHTQQAHYGVRYGIGVLLFLTGATGQRTAALLPRSRPPAANFVCGSALLATNYHFWVVRGAGSRSFPQVGMLPGGLSGGAH